MLGVDVNPFGRPLTSFFLSVFLVLAMSFAGVSWSPQPAFAGTMSQQNHIDWIGGAGGSFNSNIDCPPGSVATGYRSQTSGNSVFLGMQCHNVLPSGKLGTTITRGSGSGGVFHECPPGMAVVSVFVKNSNSPQNVGVKCQSPPNKLDDVVEVGPATGNIVKQVSCSASGFVNRNYLHSGAWFDGFAVGCTNFAGYESPVEARLTTAPSGQTLVGATLTSQNTFVGLPTPSLQYIWERAESVSGPWALVSGASGSTYTLTLDDLGFLLRSVVTGSNNALGEQNTETSESSPTSRVTLNQLQTPDLLSSSDLGLSATDNITSDSTPTFTLSGLVAGAVGQITATRASPTALSETCTISASDSAANVTSCTFPELLDGAWTYSAVQSSGGVTSTVSGNLVVTIDKSPPTATSISIVPDLSNDKRVRITIGFSEALGAVDENLISLGVDGSSWVKSNASISGSDYSFDVTYANLIDQDIRVLVSPQAASDVAGNLLTAERLFFEQVNLVAPSAQFSQDLVRQNLGSQQSTVTVTFTRPVWGLEANDFTFSPNGASCSVTSVSPGVGPSASYSVQITCNSAGTSTLTLAANSVKDFAATPGPQAPLSLTVIRDTVAPTITNVVGTQIGNSIQYSVTFSEEIASFPASALTTTGTPSTGTWVYSSPSRVGNTNQWTFTAMSSYPLTGNHVPVFNSTASILDLAGNALTANPTFAGVAVQILPTFTVGQLSPLGASAVALAPNFEIDLRGGPIHAIRITNNSWATSGSTKDAFSNLPNSGMGSSLGKSTANGVIEITAPNATQAQWQAAIRAITFDAGSSPGTRSFTFHIKPISGYDYESGAMFVGVTQGAALGQATARTLASSVYRYGYQGYLATPNSPSQAQAAANAGLNQNQGSWLWLDLMRPSGTTVVSNSGLPRDVEAGEASFTNWDSAYPGYPQPQLGAGETFVFANIQNGKWHDAFSTDNNALGYLVEFGLRGSEDLPALLSRTASVEADVEPPRVISATALSADGTYVKGETVRIQVNMDEATVVSTASGVPRIKLNTSPSSPIQYATYVSGSGTDSLIFEYVVQSGFTSADLNYADINSLELNGGTLKDAVGNDAVRTLPATSSSNSIGGSSAIVVDADLFVAPTFSLGTLPAIGPNIIQLVPNFDLTVRGTSPYGIRITNKTFTNTGVPDAFSLNPVPTGLTLVSNGSGVIELRQTNRAVPLTEAQWEAAIRSILFDAGSSGIAPEFEFHLRPLEAYDYSTGHAYRFFASSGLIHNQLKVLAEATTLAGFSGYLANPTSLAENNLILATLPEVGQQPSGYAAAIGLVKQAATATQVGTDPVKVISPAAEAGNITFVNWNVNANGLGEPNTTTDLCIQMHPTGKWNDYSCDTSAYNEYLTGYIVEYGGVTPETSFLSLMVQDATYTVDLTGPSVVSVTSLTPNATYGAGEELHVRVRFNEPISVSGVARLTLAMGPNDRTADCVAGAIATDLVCSYTIQQGDVSADLNYVAQNPLELNGAQITDLAGNAADLTLPPTNSVNSLAGSAALVIDGNRNTLTLAAAAPTSSTRALVFTLTSALQINCNSLSPVDGVDFDFTGIDSINSIVSSQDNKTCTINATSSVREAQFGVSALTKASSFSVNDRQNPPVATTEVSVLNGALVAVNVPAQTGQGVVTKIPVAGQRRTAFDRTIPSSLLDPALAAARAALDRNNVFGAPAGVPGARFEGDFTQASTPIHAKKREAILAGDKVSVDLMIDPSQAGNLEVAVFFRSTLDPVGSGWAFLGRRDFDVNGLAVSEPMVFTKIGTYHLKMIVVQKGAQFRTLSVPDTSSQPRIFLMPFFSLGVAQPQPFFLSTPTGIPDADLPAGVQTLEVVVDVTGTEPSVPSATPTPPSGGAAAAPIAPIPAPIPTPTLTPAPIPTPAPEALKPEPAPVAPVAPPVTPAAPAAPSDPAPNEPAPDPGPEPEATTEPELEPEQEPVEEVVAAPAAPEPEAATVLESYDPFGSPEAIKETTGLLSAFAAVGALAAAAGAAAAAAAAAGAAGSAAASGSSGGMAGAEMSEDSLDALAGADFELDVFADSKDRWGDKLALWAIPILSFLDKPTHNATRRVARYSPLVSKLLNDGSYLRAMLGSVSLLPTIAAIVLAVIGLTQNQDILLHPPVWIFIAILVIGLFDSFAGAMGVLVFILGSLPLVDAGEITDWRMLSGIAVAGFGPILLARSIRNFRRKAPRDASGWLDRIGDIGFASLMGGWISGLVLRALPALTGLAVPAADYVFEVQVIATVAIAVRILLEDLAARFYPSRMDDLTPDVLPEPFRFQPALVMVFRYLFYVFIASAFMGFGVIVLIAAALFLVPNLLGLITDKLPRVEFLTKWLPTGLPAIAMILGLEIVLENTLSTFFGDRPDFSTIFIFGLLALIIFLTVLGMLARPEPNQPHWLQAPNKQAIYRVGGFVTFLLLVWLTSQL